MSVSQEGGTSHENDEPEGIVLNAGKCRRCEKYVKKRFTSRSVYAAHGPAYCQDCIEHDREISKKAREIP